MTSPDEPYVIPPPVVGTRIQDLQTERWIRSVVLLVIGGPVLFAFTIGVAIKGAYDGAQRDRLIRQGIACLLSDLDDHRHTNQYAHQEIASHIDKPVQIIQPDVIPLTKQEAENLKEQCENFVRRSLGVGGLGTGGQAVPVP